MAKRVGEKAATPRRKVRAPSARKPVRRATRRAVAERAEPAEIERPVAASEPPSSSGVHVSIDDVIVEADEPQLERDQLKALLSVRRGDQLVYAERVNLDWPGGRDKFLRKATRALGVAGVATRLGEALLGELRGLIRARVTAS